MHFFDDSECKEVYFEWDYDVKQIHTNFQLYTGIRHSVNCFTVCEENKRCWGVHSYQYHADDEEKMKCEIYGANSIDRPGVHGAYSCIRTPVEKRKSVF